MFIIFLLPILWPGAAAIVGYLNLLSVAFILAINHKSSAIFVFNLKIF